MSQDEKKSIKIWQVSLFFACFLWIYFENWSLRSWGSLISYALRLVRVGIYYYWLLTMCLNVFINKFIIFIWSLGPYHKLWEHSPRNILRWNNSLLIKWEWTNVWRKVDKSSKLNDMNQLFQVQLQYNPLTTTSPSSS